MAEGMTRGEIRNLSRKRLGETTAAFWQDPELNRWIRLAGEDLAERTLCLRTNGKMTTEETATYKISNYFSNFICPTKVYIYRDGSLWYPLTQVNRDDMDKLNPGWQSYDNKVPQHYIWDQEEGNLTLSPPPNSDNAGTDYLWVYYAYEYSKVNTDNDTPELPTSLHMAMADYVVAVGYESRGHGTKAENAWNSYVSRIAKYLKNTNNQNMEDQDIISKNYRNI